MADFGMLIKRARETRLLTVRSLAEAIGKSPGYVSRIEVQGEIPSVELVAELARALGGNVEEFLQCAKNDSLTRVVREVESKYEIALSRYSKNNNS